MARPRRQFSEKDEKQISALARCHCPDSEIAAFTGIPERTLQRRFGALLKEQREAGKANLRATQFRMAIGDEAKGIAPNITMLIWVGKQILGQSEKVSQTVDTRARISIEDQALLDAANKMADERPKWPTKQKADIPESGTGSPVPEKGLL